MRNRAAYHLIIARPGDKRIYRLTLVLIAILVPLSTILSSKSRADDPQQVVVSATPARIQIATSTQAVTESLEATATWTPSPTPRGVVFLEALNEANVRAEPDVDSARLGTIRAGETYPVLGRSFRWIQFQYEPSPNGRGWVFEELVTIIGDAADIVDLNANTLPEIDTAEIEATQTAEAIALTPGGILTVTAQSRVIQAPVGAPNLADASQTPEDMILPTFTYPPNVPIGVAATEGGAILPVTVDTSSGAEASTRQVAPITPILILGGLGLLGLFFSAIRK